MTKRNRILATLGILVLCSVFGASQALGAQIGGKVLTLTDPQVAVGAGVTVSVHPSGTPSTATDANGSWQLTVPDGSDPVLKIGASGAAGTVETYTEFPLSLLMDYQSGPYEYDISAVPAATMASVPAGSCLVVGFALRYTYLGYPAAQDFIAGVVISPTPTAYIKADGVTPCIPPLECNATSTVGGWVGIQVPPGANYSGVIPDSGGSCAGAAAAVVLTGGDVTCVADTANVTGVVHPTLP